MERDELRNDLAIDPAELDVEAHRHSDLVWKWGQRMALARKRAKDLKLAVDVLEAKTELNIRGCPSDYGLDKVTEPTIKAAVVADKAVIAMKQQHLDAEGEEKLLAVAYEAITTKGKDLHELTELYKGQYFAGPAQPHDLPVLVGRRVASGGLTVPANNRQAATARRRA